MAANPDFSPGRLDTMPRQAIGHLNTPIEEMTNLSAEIGGPRLLVKRDDYTGLGMGGNKVRQLEFYLGEALDKAADTIVITGAVQSNFVRTCAAMSAKLGLACHIQLEERVPKNDPLYRSGGNVLLDKMAGAHLYSHPVGEDEHGADNAIEELADKLREEGKSPYVIHLSPEYPPFGAVGYVLAARELLKQIEEQGLEIDRLFLASGSAATHVGMLWGLRAFGSDLPVTGVCVRRTADLQLQRVSAMLSRMSTLLEYEVQFAEDDIQLTDVSLAPGYGRLNDMTREAIALAGRCEGIFLDPVYTGKVMAGMIHGLRNDILGIDQVALFLHTGGTPAIFAYGDEVLGG